MKRMLLALLLCAGTAFSASFSSVHATTAVPTRPAQGSARPVVTEAFDHIGMYYVESDIGTDGAVDITERITYTFAEPRHGIFRTIPVLITNDGGTQYEMTVENIRVSDANAAAVPFTQSMSDGTLTLRIGDPDKTVEGDMQYVISYRVKGAMTYFPGHDEWYWNAVGSGWSVPVAGATVRVAVPGNLSPDSVNLRCFTGSDGSSDASCTHSYGADTALFATTKLLAPGEGFTVVVGLPKGTVAVLEPRELVPFFSTVTGKIVLVLIGIVACAWYVVAPVVVVRNWFVRGRDPKPPMGDVAAWFAPPKNKKKTELTPAETGTLIDERADLSDIYATIVDLARRGYLKIIETKKNAFTLEKTKDWVADSSLMHFERELLSGLFKTGDSVAVSTIDLSGTIGTIQKLLYEQLVADGFFPSNPNTLRNTYVAIGVFSLLTLNPVMFLVCLTFGYAMPRKTLFGAQEAVVARSLKRFLASQDEKLAFQAKNQMMFEKLLPYAVAFGVEEIWAKRFADVKLTNPDWYVSGTGSRFNSLAFAHSIGSGMSVSFARSVTYKSSRGFSSGFSSGGGFSGGGRGGGGGGSW